MKRLHSLISLMFLVIFIAGMANVVQAKNPDRKLSKEIKKKAAKQARKEAKKFKRGHWYVAPGALPMDKQIEKSWELQYMDDENGYPLYIVATGNSVAETQSAAKLQAIGLSGGHTIEQDVQTSVVGGPAAKDLRGGRIQSGQIEGGSADESAFVGWRDGR